jgi:hypothetical protein
VIGGSEDERLLGLVASALVAIDELEDLKAFEMPYPPQVQRTLDRLVLHCLRRQARPPKSVQALVRWGYERYLGVWPLVLPHDVYPMDEFLIDAESGAPTALCHEIALCAETDNPVQEARRRMAWMADLTAERNQAWAYSAMRGLLAKQPMCTNDQLNDMRFAIRLGVLDEHLGDFYRQIGPEYTVDGEVFPCAQCRTPLRPADAGSWWCEREECQTANAVSQGDPLDWDAKVLLQMDRRHRQFVSGPDRAVLRVADCLASPGVTVSCWPAHGADDLRVEIPRRHLWTAVVVDWHSPALLGRAIASAVAQFGAGDTVWIAAQYRVDADPGYLRVVREHATTATETPLVYSEKEFTAMVRLREEESGHA